MQCVKLFDIIRLGGKDTKYRAGRPVFELGTEHFDKPYMREQTATVTSHGIAFGSKLKPLQTSVYTNVASCGEGIKPVADAIFVATRLTLEGPIGTGVLHRL
jgi:hypothetical protein